jgi:hypothetical protein
VLGVTVGPTRETDNSGTLSVCSYAPAPTGEAGQLKVYCSTAGSGKSSFVQAGSFQNPQPVTGLGDAAYWVGLPDNGEGELTVFVGEDIYIAVDIIPPTANQTLSMEPMAEALARIALSRL